MKSLPLNILIPSVATSTRSDNQIYLYHSDSQDVLLAKKVLTIVMRFRRSLKKQPECNISCSVCHSPHLPNIIAAISQGKPVTFVLPAFPGKSPNLSKVLSPAPDMAEQRALKFLNRLCINIKKYYSPGARIILCSDGRVFSDVIGMKEADVTEYRKDLHKMIQTYQLENLSIFDLDEMCVGQNFDQMRGELLSRYGQDISELKEKIRKGSKQNSQKEDAELNRMYRGITRFLVEDSLYPGQQKSRTAIQKDCRIRAGEVIRRSNAWSKFLEDKFPAAVRLSIHPQTCGSEKLGICLLGNETWMTPWHGVAMKTYDGYVLMKRFQAEQLGAKLIYTPDGKPDYFDLTK